MKKAKKGFTLVELIVVIAIIAILAAVSVAGYYGFIESAKQSAADQEAAQAKIALQAAFTPSGEVTTSKGTSADDTSDDVVYEFAWTTKGIELINTKNVNDALVATGVGDIFELVLVEKAGYDASKFSLSCVAADFEEAQAASTNPATPAKNALVKAITYTVAGGKSSVISFVA